MMIKRIIVTSLIGVLIFALLLTPLSYAWLANSLNKNTQIESYVHKSYFESGDGKTVDQFIDGTHGDDQSNCAFEIKYPVQLYYFAWLQALGYFNIPSNGEGTPISPVYFYLSEDLDMTGWVLPQIGTQTYPFVGNFDGNGHTVSNLTVQNIESSDSTIWNDKPSNITGLNIVGMFGVIGSIGGNTVNAAIANNDAFTPTAGYTYSSSTNEVKNFVLNNAVIKTDLSESLAGMAAGYVNGTMENVKVVGGTLHSTATSPLSYTTNLSDYAAVGYCTANYRDSNNVVTVLIYDPQVYTNAEGSALGQGNNWGNSINMKSMYEDILAVYNDYGTDIDEDNVAQKIITVNKTDGEVSSVTVTGSGESPLSTGNYTLKVVEKKDGNDTVAYFNLVDRSTNFMYLYGGKTYISEPIEKDSFYIHDSTSSHYFSINANAQITDVGSSSTATKWIIENNKIYTILTKTTTDPESQETSTEDWFYYVIKDNNNQLQIVEVSQREETPSSVTSSPWTVETDSITTGGYNLVFNNGSWKLVQPVMHISNNAENAFLSTTDGSNISNSTTTASATVWGKESAADNGFYLYTIINDTNYYLNCSNAGILSISTTATTVWYEDTAVAGQHKVYMKVTLTEGFALLYNGANWVTTTYSTAGSGSDWGGSMDMYGLYTRLLDVYDNYAFDSGNSTIKEITYLDSQDMTINTETVGVSGSGHYKGYSSTTEDYSYTFNKHEFADKNFMYLYGNVSSSISQGEATVQHISMKQTTVSGQQFQITYSEEISGFYVTCTVSGTKYYLTNSSTTSTKAVTDVSAASIWHKETVAGQSYFFLYTYVDGVAKYLQCPDYNGKATIASKKSTSVYQQIYINNGLYYKKNGDSYYFYYDPTHKNGARWTVPLKGTVINYSPLESFTQTTNFYLSISSSMSLSSETNNSSVGEFLTLNNKIITLKNNQIYYLMGSSSSIYLSQDVTFENATDWTSSSSGLSFISGGTTYYLHLSPGLGVLTSSQSVGKTNTTILPSTAVWQTTYVGENTSRQTGTAGFPTSYMPLSVNSGNIFQTKSNNTGYIVSGKASAPSSHMGGSDEDSFYQAGDIRVSKYGMYNLTSTSTIYTINGSGRSSNMSGFEKYEDAREGLDSMFTADSEWIYGLHFMNASISSSDVVTIPSAVINGETYLNYTVPRDCIDFHLKEKGYINFFAGTYFSVGQSGENNVFFSLHKITRDSNNNITNIQEIKRIFGPNEGTGGYVYDYTGSTAAPSGYSVVFNTSWLTNPGSSNWTNNAIYYFEIPVNAGEYALGSTSGNGAYLMYLDISSSGDVVADSKIYVEALTPTNHTDSGKLSYTELEPSENETPTYFPLAWSRYGEGNSYDYRGDLPANTNTGYVVSGSNSTSNPPGDIRVSRYSKYANGNWASIRASLTSTDAAGILDNTKVYTIVNGAQVNINSYGIGIIHTMQYGSVSKTVNELLNGNQYVYGLHFMQSTISIDKTVTVPKAIINETTYTNYVMPQDCIDFKVSSKGRVAFMAGTYFSGSSGVQSFFSLHRIFRDGSNNITSIKQLSEVYSDGNAANGYIYRYKDDTNYYNADGTLNGNSVPSGYVKVYDLKAIDDPGSLGISLTQNSVYYFEIPVDAGEYALGSSNSDGAYLIYLDIAAGADYAVQTTTTEVSVQKEYTNNYPKGVAFVDAYNSTVFDTEGEADPSKSVFMSIPVGAASNGNTTFSIDSNGNMTVTNSSSTLTGVTAQSIPMNGSLTVNNNDITMTPSKEIIVEKVTTVLLDMAGTTTTTVTTTTQATIDGVTTTEVVQTVTTEFNGSTNTTTTTPAPTYDGHDLIPDDLTSQTNPKAKADTILEFIYTATGVNTTSERIGDVNIVETQYTITVNGQLFTVYDVVKDSNANPVVYGATYNITLSGAANVTITKYNNDFAFSINGNAVTQESQSISVTNP